METQNNKTRARILDLGYNTKYAPITPEIAPEAPIVGMPPPTEFKTNKMCVILATIPDKR